MKEKKNKKKKKKKTGISSVCGGGWGRGHAFSTVYPSFIVFIIQFIQNVPYLDTRHPETDIWQKKKKNHKKKHGFNVGFQPYADHDIYLASVMVGVCTRKVEEEPVFRGGGGEELPQACSCTDEPIQP